MRDAVGASERREHAGVSHGCTVQKASQSARSAGRSASRAPPGSSMWWSTRRSPGVKKGSARTWSIVWRNTPGRQSLKSSVAANHASLPSPHASRGGEPRAGRGSARLVRGGGGGAHPRQHRRMHACSLSSGRWAWICASARRAAHRRVPGASHDLLLHGEGG